jgi:hypothetical protein
VGVISRAVMGHLRVVVYSLLLHIREASFLSSRGERSMRDDEAACRGPGDRKA